MSQEWDAPQNNQSAKAVDFALVIAGWPTIYTVARSYTLPSSGDLSDSSGSGFDSKTRAWASLQGRKGAAARGRPEEGTCSSGSVAISVLDYIASGRRELTELCSRQIYGQAAGDYPRLTSEIDEASTDIAVTSVAGFSSTGGFAYLGIECLRYSSVNESTSALEGCSRGRLLTPAMPHDAGVGIYAAMPTLQSRRAFLYKGYQSLGIDRWVRSFGGAIDGVERLGAAVTISLVDTMSLTRQKGNQVLLGPPTEEHGPGVFRPAILGDFLSPAYIDFLLDPEIKVVFDGPQAVIDSHRLLNVAGTWLGVTGIVPGS